MGLTLPPLPIPHNRRNQRNSHSNIAEAGKVFNDYQLAFKELRH